MINPFASVAQNHPPLGADLQSALKLIPAPAWYAVPSGALTFVNQRGSDYLGLPKDHPLRYGIDTEAAWDSHIPLLHPDDQEETRRVWSTCLRTGGRGEVSFRVRNAEGRGSVRLASGNFQDAAVIDGNYLDTDQDFAAVVRAIEIARELGSQHAFDNLRESELIPGPQASAEEIRELARLASASFGHAVGACKMGVDKLSVVDPELRVHGILGLRVADASVMPHIITGPGTNASTHMIAGRAAKLILG